VQCVFCQSTDRALLRLFLGWSACAAAPYHIPNSRCRSDATSICVCPCLHNMGFASCIIIVIVDYTSPVHQQHQMAGLCMLHKCSTRARVYCLVASGTSSALNAVWQLQHCTSSHTQHNAMAA
jgi:hypothetical protein